MEELEVFGGSISDGRKEKQKRCMGPVFVPHQFVFVFSHLLPIFRQRLKDLDRMERIIAKNETSFNASEWEMQRALNERELFFSENESWKEAMNLCNADIMLKGFGVSSVVIVFYLNKSFALFIFSTELFCTWYWQSLLVCVFLFNFSHLSLCMLLQIGSWCRNGSA